MGICPALINSFPFSTFISYVNNPRSGGPDALRHDHVERGPQGVRDRDGDDDATPRDPEDHRRAGNDPHDRSREPGPGFLPVGVPHGVMMAGMPKAEDAVLMERPALRRFIGPD